MKTIRTFVSSLALLSLAACLARASSYETTYVESYKGRANMPVPVSVVAPSLTKAYGDEKVDVRFTVDTTGTPRDIAIVSAVDSELAAALTTAVASWRFNPEMRDGKPVARTVLLPILLND